MSETKKPETPHALTTVQPGRTDWKGVQRIYSNSVQVFASSWDVLLFVGETEPLLGPNNVVESATVVPHAVITMSHEHARAFAAAVQNIVGQLDAVKRTSTTVKAPETAQ